MQLHDQLAHYPIATQSHPPCQLKILTRRDQLRLKQAKDDEKKEAKAAKKAAKEAKELHQDKKGEADGKTKKPGRKRKTEATDHDDHAEGDTADSEKPKKQAKRLRKAEEKQDDHVCEPEDADMVPEPKAKAKAKATAKRGAKSKAENVEKVGEAKAKAASKRKAKAKPVPKDEEPQKDDAEEDSESEMSVATPKKNLFQESDGESSEESAHDRLVKKTGELKPLDQIFEDDLPSQWKRSKAAGAEPAASSAADPAKPKGAARKQPKAALSPLAKKMAKKRKKAVEDTMREQLSEDKSLQAILNQHLKAVSGKTFDEVKQYLLKQGPKDCGKFVLDPYWGRTACGVKSKELGNGGKKTMSLVAYFASFGTAPDWNTSMSLVYLSAWLMATWLINIKMYQDVH